MRVLTSLCLVAMAAARGRLTTCSATGDPHYKPFAGGRKAKFTVMGEGEFCLAKKGTFHASACSWDVSEGRKSTKKLTWNRDFQVTDDGVQVLVDGGNTRVYKLTVTDGVKVVATETLGLHTAADTWGCDPNAKGSLCKNIINNDKVEVKLMRKRRAKKANRIIVKFKKTNRMVIASIASKTTKRSKFGKRTLFNIIIKVPKKDSKTYTGLCGQTKSTMRGGQSVLEGLKTTYIPGCKAENGEDLGTPSSQGTDELVEELIKTQPCNADQASFAVQACSNVDQDDKLGCIMDKLTGCDADGVEDLIDFEKTKIDYTCPVSSYISATTWPLVSFEDCTCMWGHTRDAEAETCTPKTVSTATTLAVQTSGACFCDGTAPRHCMHNALGDGSCGLPLDSDAKECTNPNDAMDSSKCKCGTGTTDCTGTKYHLHIAKQPSMANPKQPFGQQPVVKLVDAAGNLIKDSRTKVRVSIANAQDSSCACDTDKPCRHNNVGDNTCHSKHMLFGDSVCPPGTTECLPGQSSTKLYQAIAGEDGNSPDSLEAKTTQCRVSTDMNRKKENFCSGMTPCKHKNDGSCVQKTAFYAQKVEAKPVNTKTCKGTADWRRAVPSPVTGWFFETDSTCSMDKSTLGCSDDSHSYAMDKWCEVNCNPKYPGQPAFCPPSHCDCYSQPAAKTEPNADWQCPADRYDDGSCRCTPGTEFCGSIEVQLVNGVASFEHLTIGTEGRYQLLAEVVMPDQNTGSNNVRVNGKTGVFDVVYPKKSGTTCRAQAAWRKPAMYDSKAHGEGEAWFYEDSKKCLSRTDAGACESVDKEPTYAMDKWCKANNCAKHTLERHCELYSPADRSSVPKCTSNVYDMFGDCCQTGQNVDACGVCGGDGSTCKVVSYLSEPVPVSGATDVIFNASLAHPSCDMKSPCMHLNDKTCVPKTVNSAILLGDAHHCFWDRKSRADEQPNWKYGTWDVEGRLSKSIETQIEDGNNDCYCSAGTVDISKKIQIEEKAKEDYLATLIKQVDHIKKDSTDGKTPVEDVIIRNSNAAVAYDTAGCSANGRTTKLSSIYNNVMCGTHFDGSSGKGHCYKSTSTTCANDKVRSIMLPPMCTAKLYKHCSSPTAAKQVRYKSLENFGTTAKCVELPETDVSTIEIEGEVLKIDAKVVGTTADCFESQCFEYVEKCLSDATCSDALHAAENDVAKGDNFISAMKENIGTASKAFDALITCAGLAIDKCVPSIAANPFTLPDVSVVKDSIPSIVELTTATVPTPVPATFAPTDAPTAKPTTQPTDAPTIAPTEAATVAAPVITAAPTNTPTVKPTNAPTVAATAPPTSAFVKQVVNPSHYNNPNNIGVVTVAEPARLLCSCTSRPIVPVVRYVRYESLFGRRLAGAIAVTPTAIVQVSSSGNQGIMGSTATSPASAAATGSATANVASSGGIGAAGTALIAVGCIGLVGALAAVGLSRKNTKSAAPVGNSNVVMKAASEDQTDVL